MNLFKKKSLNDVDTYLKKPNFQRIFSGFDLLLLCVGATIGSGIFVLTGVAAANFAGPAITLSFLLSGIICIFMALAYAELASIAPISGSAYTYTFITMGEFIAWLVGWCLFLEYMLTASALASAWSGYMVGLLKAGGFAISDLYIKDPFSGGLANVPAILITLLMSLLLIKGTKESSLFNKILVYVKLLTIFSFVYIAVPMIDVANWQDFFPYGINGMLTGAAVIFYAFVGFDTVSTAAEECKNPKRDVPIGLVGGLAVCILLFMIVSGALTGIANFTLLNNAEPLAFALRINGNNIGSALVATGAVAGISTALLAMMYGQSRILFTISKDKLLPAFFSKIHPKYKTPHISTIFTAVIVAIISSLMPLQIIGMLSSLGTLIAFSIVSIGVMTLRIKQPNLKRPFKCPALFVIGPLSVICSMYLISQLLSAIGYAFVIWGMVGICFYFVYGIFFRKNEFMDTAKPAEVTE